MDIKNLDEAIKLQKEFTAKLGRAMGALRKGKAPDPEELLRQHEESISQIQAELESATKEREATLKRWDQRVERHKMSLAQLKEELAELKKKLKGKSAGRGAPN